MNNIELVNQFIKEEDFNNIYYHFAVSQNNNSIEIFLDGFRSSIPYPAVFIDDKFKLKDAYIFKQYNKKIFTKTTIYFK